MAGTSSKSKKEMEQLLEQYCSVTGATKDAGRPLLEACNWDVDMAVGMHMDGGGACDTALPPGGDLGGAGPSTEGATNTEADGVRAPIPQKREVLIENYPGYVPTGRRRGARSVFDAFRDFQAETKQAEERASRGEVLPAAPPRKRRTLEELFRPPVDLIHKGSFHSAKDAGTAANKWLLVNVQNVQEFNCQVLNRDVWSNATVRNIIKKHFVFWQVYSDSEDGKRYMQFYNIIKWPYMAIVDPQTGEKFVEWNDVDMKTVLELINVFLAEHPCPDSSVASPPAKKARLDQPDSIIDESEDSQLMAAIQASLRQSKSGSTIVLSSDSEEVESDDSDNDVETFSDSDSGSTRAQVGDSQGTVSNANLGTISNSDFVDSDTRDSCGSFREKASKKSSKGKGKQSKNSKNALKNGKCSNRGAVLDTDEDSRLSRLSNVDSQESTSRDGTTSESVAPPSESWEDYLGSQEDEKTKLLIRYPDGQRAPLAVPCSSKLKALTLYVSHNDIDLDHHELVTNFPRRNLSEMNLEQTLKESGLHPQETVFVQEKS